MNFRPHSGRRSRRCSGQTFLFIVVFVAVFLAGVIGISTDYSQVWARRQMAQAAADAACQAGAADLYINYVNPAAATTYGLDYSWIGTAYDCSTNTASSPCQYASLNGYSGSGVAVTFPSSVPGAPPLTGFGVTTPYIKVEITEPVALSFTKLLSSTGTVNVKAKATCGMVTVSSPIPLLVLHPSMDGALNRNGGATFTIYGGPQRSIQVNSSSASAVTPLSGGSGAIDLSKGGPDGTGADFGVFGNESEPSYVLTGTTGKWVSPALPWTDPWANVAAPSAPATTGAATFATFGTNGCPDPSGCVEFAPGNYVGCTSGSTTLASGGQGCLIVPTPYRFSFANWNNSTAYLAGAIIKPTAHNAGSFVFQAQNAGTSQSGSGPNPWNQTQGLTTTDGTITWLNIGALADKPKTAIFDPGLYYVGAEGLQLGAGSTARQSTATGDGNNGTTFYFSSGPGNGQNIGTINVGSSTGTQTGCIPPSTSSCIASYKPDGSSQTFGSITVASPAMQCSGGDPPPYTLPDGSVGVPASVDGNILMGPCTGTYEGTSDGHNRGFLFFQNRATTVAASWSGGGQFILSGFMYFHNSSDFSSSLSMAGNPAGNALTLGDIVTDQVNISGTSAIRMILNPNVTAPVLRPSLIE